MTRSPSRDADDSWFGNRVRTFLKLALALSIGLAVWLIGFRPADETAVPVLPETETQFSLDLAVTATIDHDIVYAVEQRARPYYRIFSLDPATGTVDTVFTVPEDAIIFGIALSPDHQTMAIAYSPDFHIEGNGISLLDLATGGMTETVPVTLGFYLTDIAWAPDGSSVLATSVDRSSSDETLAAVRISATTGEITTLTQHAINPVQVDDVIYYLSIDDNKARRSIGMLEPGGNESNIDVGDGGNDLDHLTVAGESHMLNVAVLDTTDAGIAIGDPAGAHGNHDQPSTWWTITLDAADKADGSAPTALEPIIVYDAAATNNSIVYATSEGLAIGIDERIDIIKSRAIRFVAA